MIDVHTQYESGRVTITAKCVSKTGHLKLYINGRFVKSKRVKPIPTTFKHNTRYQATTSFTYVIKMMSGTGKVIFTTDKFTARPKHQLNSTYNGWLRTSRQLDDYTFQNETVSTIAVSIHGHCFANIDGSLHVVNGARVVKVMSKSFRVRVFGKIGPYTIQASPDKPISERRFALIVGISDYKTISDLNFCDEDSTDWHTYLSKNGYECTVLGDRHSHHYPRYDGLATRQNVRSVLGKIVSGCKPGDKLVFVTSGHGSGDGNGTSYLCLIGGKYWDYELSEDLRQADNNVDKIVIIDHCYSGGFIDNLKKCKGICTMTTCSEKGYGYDMPSLQNGAWTFALLERSINSYFKGAHNIPLQNIFQYASKHYTNGSEKVSFEDKPVMYTDKPWMTIS